MKSINILLFLVVIAFMSGCGNSKQVKLEEVEFRMNTSLLNKQQVNIGKSDFCVATTKLTKSKINTSCIHVLADSALQLSTIFLDSNVSSSAFLSKIAGQPSVVLENDSFLLKGQTIHQRFLQSGNLVLFEIKFRPDSLSSRMLLVFEAKSRDKLIPYIESTIGSIKKCK